MAAKWSTFDLAGHECEVFTPGRPNPHRFAVIYLHGVHENYLHDQPVFTAELERHGLPCVCPRGGQSWWSDRLCAQFDPQITAERYLLDTVIPHLNQRWGSQPPRIGVFGTSMGGQGALRLAFKHPRLLPVVAAISPAIDYHLRFREHDPVLMAMYADQEAARQDTATLHVHPLNWPRNLWFCCDPTDPRWHESAERLRMKLAALGVPYECDLETSGGGHGFAYYNLMAARAIGFLADRLEQERRRVV